MKKVSIFFLAFLLFHAFGSTAQTCDAGFSIQALSPNLFQFQPANSNNTTIGHYWNFGDGEATNDPSPSHNFLAVGTYTVQHTIQGTINGTFCSRTETHIVTVTSVICNLSANFIFHRDSLNTTNPYVYYFKNTSVGVNYGDSIRWSFGDGTFSNNYNPVHAYTQPGNYTVCLRIIKRQAGVLTNCISDICFNVSVIANTCTFNANFYWYRDSSASNPLTYHFENTSAPLNSSDSIRWTFGDGSSSNALSPNHVYAVAGVYNVCLRIIKRNPAGDLTNCVREICRSVVVGETCNLQASFYFFRDSTSAGSNAYHFINTSTSFQNTDSIRWTFGDGSSSNQINPVHIYSQPGTYNVCLRIIKRNSNGTLSSCVREVCHTVVVGSLCNVTAHFTWRADSLVANRIHFINNSVPLLTTSSVYWTFGDGTQSNVVNPIKEYAQPGRYQVCLTVTNGASCTSTWCDSITVGSTTPGCIAQSNFSWLRSSTDAQLLHFIPTYSNPALQYTWTFGDGTGSQNIQTFHRYTNPGTYNACLTVFRDPQCASTTCKPVSTGTTLSCNTIQLSYTYTPDVLVPNKIRFTAQSPNTIIDQLWIITRISTGQQVYIHANNPVYAFMDTGYYRVCLKATFFGGCIREYCQEIRIDHINQNACTLQLFPNPATVQINASILLQQATTINAYIYTSMNVLVRQAQQPGIVGNNTVTIAIGDLPAGTYILKLTYANNSCHGLFQKL